MPNPPRVFTIPASAPFLPTLIKALIDGRLVDGFAPGADPLALATATLYLPTRRAARLARDVFLDVLGTEAAILPRIVAIGDVDEDEIAFDEAGRGDFGAALDVPEALGGLQRRLLLATLVTTWAKTIAPGKKGEAPLIANNPAAALALADDLARLMDDLATRQVPFEQLDALVPREVDDYWQLTLRFLKIAREAWPAILAEKGKIEPAARRDRLIKAEAERLARSKGPVVAAGSTGSIPATAELLATIAGLAQGAMVLAGARHRSRHELLGEDRRRRRTKSSARRRPCAIRHARLAQAHRHHARCGDGAGRTRSAWARAHCLGSFAPGRDNAALAAKTDGAGFRTAGRHCAVFDQRDRSGQCGRGSARRRGGAARGGGNAGHDSGAGHARPRAGAARAGGAGALECDRERLRRRCATGHARRRFRAARRRRRARWPCAGDAAGSAQAPAAAARRGRKRA